VKYFDGEKEPVRAGGAIHIVLVLVALAAMVIYSLAASRPVAVDVLSVIILVVVLAQALVVRWQRSRVIPLPSHDDDEQADPGETR
jgi:hypothetical protein